MMKQVWVHQVEGVAPSPLFQDGPVEDFGGDQEVASLDITIFTWFYLQNSSVAGTLERLNELDWARQGLCTFSPYTLPSSPLKGLLVALGQAAV